MTYPTLYRKRLIPNECVLLKDDVILLFETNRIVTKWNALKPKKNLHHGYSCYLLDLGIKFSKFYKEDNTLLYWYIDIIESDYYSSENKFIMTDLLADVLIYPDGFVKVIDLEELVTALDDGLLSLNQLKTSISTLDHLLQLIYSGEFKKYQDFLESFEN